MIDCATSLIRILKNLRIWIINCLLFNYKYNYRLKLITERSLVCCFFFLVSSLPFQGFFDDSVWSWLKKKEKRMDKVLCNKVRIKESGKWFYRGHKKFGRSLSANNRARVKASDFGRLWPSPVILDKAAWEMKSTSPNSPKFKSMKS